MPDDQDRLEDLVYEGFNKLLVMLRKIEVEQKTLADAQAKLKDAFDEVWAEQAAKGMKPRLLPEGLKVVEALAKIPVAAELLKKLLGM